MHPNALLELATELLHRVLQFKHPADSVVSDFFRQHKALGSRERHTLAETTYTVLRQRLWASNIFCSHCVSGLQLWAFAPASLFAPPSEPAPIDAGKFGSVCPSTPPFPLQELIADTSAIDHADRTPLEMRLFIAHSFRLLQMPSSPPYTIV